MSDKHQGFQGPSNTNSRPKSSQTGAATTSTILYVISKYITQAHIYLVHF